MTEIKNEQTKDLTPSRGLIGRAKAVDRIWTVMFYLVALFFLLLLFAFAGYVIIGLTEMESETISSTPSIWFFCLF